MTGPSGFTGGADDHDGPEPVPVRAAVLLAESAPAGASIEAPPAGPLPVLGNLTFPAGGYVPYRPAPQPRTVADAPPEGALPTVVTISARRRWRRRLPVQIGVVVLVALVVLVLIRAFAFEVVEVPSVSMAPTLKVGDRVVVSKVALDLRSLHPGDIVVFARPVTDPDHRYADLIKRVVALPGQTISQSPSGTVMVNGVPLKEPYLPPGTVTQGITTMKVPAGDYYVLGDNRGDSYDSRHFGPIPGSSIVGVAQVRVWPLSRVSGV